MPPKIKYAVDLRTADMPTEALDCRAERHDLPRLAEAAGSFKPTKEGVGLELERECRKCGAVATEVFNVATGERITRRAWKYPAGYLLPKPDRPGDLQPRLSMDAARAAYFERLFK